MNSTREVPMPDPDYVTVCDDEFIRDKAGRRTLYAQIVTREGRKGGRGGNPSSGFYSADLPSPGGTRAADLGAAS